MTCSGGAGVCGTCAVRVLEGMSNMNAPSKNEQKVLLEKKKAAEIRLSCCSRVSGPISIETKP
jgi:ferredoxin